MIAGSIDKSTIMAAAMIFFKHFVRDARRRFRWLVRDSSGFALLESVMAVTIFAALGTAVMVGIRTANISGAIVEDQSFAEKLARNQMEYVFTQPYQAPPGSYVSISDATDVIFTVDAGVTVSAAAAVYTEGDPTIVNDTNIEKVIVTVNIDGNEVLALETLRTNSP